MTDVFKPTEINRLTLRNRFIRSATYEAMASEDGSCTQKLTDLMVGLAEGGVGLIITGHAFVRPDGQAGPFQIGLFDDSSIEGYRNMTESIHKKGGRIIIQVSHAGNYANPVLTDNIPLVPSHIKGITKNRCREMNINDISEIVTSFAETGKRAKDAGFDGIQIHAAHGYLLSQFLSPIHNRRKDEYGGSIENRSRLLLDVFKGVRSAVGANFPVFIKLNCRDFQDGGLDIEESIVVGRLLQKQGIDAIELSGGTLAAGRLGPIRVGINSEKEEAYFRQEALFFKEHLKVPIILVGGIRSFGSAKELVEKGYADYISMSRPFIREPDLINRWESGDRTRATCISDNRCLSSAISGKGLYCVTDEKVRS
jgi:2,4-dienoyl-CoA reductase-like NADH-dependent reductase (Old Yellow Enzyme family)